MCGELLTAKLFFASDGSLLCCVHMSLSVAYRLCHVEILALAAHLKTFWNVGYVANLYFQDVHAPGGRGDLGALLFVCICSYFIRRKARL